MVSVPAIYSEDPSANPAEVYSFYSVNCLKRTEIIQKRPGMAHQKQSFSMYDMINKLRYVYLCP